MSPTAGRLAVRSELPGGDDALLLRIGDERAFGLLEIAAGLVDLPLEEIAGIGGGLVAPLERGVDEAVGNAVRDQRCQLRRGRIVAELDQLPLFGAE